MLRRSPHDREIWTLALPALGALIAEPLFVATDTAMVGHLGSNALAGLAIAGTVMQTAIGLLVFLAYASTPAVARRLGSGDQRGGVQIGIDGLWLALALGAFLAALGALTARPLIAAFGPTDAVADAAHKYLAVAVWGLPGMLLVIAATGLFRGLRDTRTPLVVAGVGAVANALLNALLIYGFGWGIAGSAAGTVITQWAMAAACVAVAVRHGRRAGASTAPTLRNIRFVAQAGGWLFVRTLSLRLVLIGVTVTATSHGTVVVAGTQVVLTLFMLIALALDALAIAAQTMIGHHLGAREPDAARSVLRRLMQLSVVGGVVIGVLLVAASPVLGRVFTSDADVLAVTPIGFCVLALGLPVAAAVFALDGVLIGAGDARYLAWTGLAQLAVVVPLLVVVARLDLGSIAAVALVQGVVSVVYMLARLATLWPRARSGRWIRLGA